MSSLPKPNVPASTVDKNSAESPSDTSCVFCDESDRSAGTGGHLLRGYEFVSYDGAPVEEFPWTHECVSRATVRGLEEIRPGETAAGQAPVRSDWDGREQKVKTELPSAVSNISSSCVTHNPRTGNTRDSKPFRPVARRSEQSGVSGRKMQGRPVTRAFTRSQGRVPSEEDGANTGGGSTAVGTRIDVGLKDIKKEKL